MMRTIKVCTTRNVLISGMHTPAGQVVEVAPATAYDLLDGLAAELVNPGDMAALIDARRAENQRVLSLRAVTPEPYADARWQGRL